MRALVSVPLYAAVLQPARSVLRSAGSGTVPRAGAIPGDELRDEYSRLFYASSFGKTVPRAEELDAQTEQFVGYRRVLLLEDPDAPTAFAGVSRRGCGAAGPCEACAVTFAGVDDAPLDGFAPLPFCGIQDAVATHVRNLRSFYRDLPRVIAELSREKCRRVYAAGSDNGGAVASLFAFCANREDAAPGDEDQPRFRGVGREVTLVTFDGAPVSRTPLYNGREGRCFRGARFIFSQARVPGPPQAYLLAVIALARDLLPVFQRPDAGASFGAALAEIEGATGATDLLRRTAGEAWFAVRVPVFLVIGGVFGFDSPTFKAAAPLIGKLFVPFKEHLEATHYSVNPLVTPDYSWLHPQVEVVPLANPVTATDSTSRLYETPAGSFLRIVTGDEKPAAGGACSATAPNLPFASRWDKDYGLLWTEARFAQRSIWKPADGGYPTPACCYPLAMRAAFGVFCNTSAYPDYFRNSDCVPRKWTELQRPEYDPSYAR